MYLIRTSLPEPFFSSILENSRIGSLLHHHYLPLLSLCLSVSSACLGNFPVIARNGPGSLVPSLMFPLCGLQQNSRLWQCLDGNDARNFGISSHFSTPLFNNCRDRLCFLQRRPGCHRPRYYPTYLSAHPYTIAQLLHSLADALALYTTAIRLLIHVFLLSYWYSFRIRFRTSAAMQDYITLQLVSGHPPPLCLPSSHLCIQSSSFFLSPHALLHNTFSNKTTSIAEDIDSRI